MFYHLCFRRLTLSILFTFIALNIQIASQSTTSPRIEIPENVAPMNCESNSAYIGHLSDRVAQQMKDADDSLILIARLGDGEKKTALNKRRLFNLKQKLEVEGVSGSQIIVAEGERTKGHGRVNIYLNGKLYGDLSAYKNGDLCVSCCGPDEQYYPTKEPRKKRR